MKPEEFEAVREVLLEHLHSTEDPSLQAALWQVLESHDRMERRTKLALLILAK